MRITSAMIRAVLTFIGTVALAGQLAAQNAGPPPAKAAKSGTRLITLGTTADLAAQGPRANVQSPDRQRRPYLIDAGDGVTGASSRPAPISANR